MNPFIFLGFERVSASQSIDCAHNKSYQNSVDWTTLFWTVGSGELAIADISL